MAIEDSIRTRLLAQTAVTAITSTIRPYKLAQQDTLPAIVLMVETETFNNSIDYQGGLVDCRMRIMAVAESLASARALAEAIRGNNSSGSPNGLAGYEGTVSGIEIQGCELTSREVQFEPFGDDSDAGFYHVDSIFLIQHTETP